MTEAGEMHFEPHSPGSWSIVLRCTGVLGSERDHPGERGSVRLGLVGLLTPWPKLRSSLAHHMRKNSAIKVRTSVSNASLCRVLDLTARGCQHAPLDGIGQGHAERRAPQGKQCSEPPSHTSLVS